MEIFSGNCCWRALCLEKISPSGRNGRSEKLAPRLRNFHEVFINFLTISDVFERVRSCSDAFGRVRMRSDAIGCILSAFGGIWTLLEFFGFFGFFRTILMIFGRFLSLGAYYLRVGALLFEGLTIQRLR